MESIFNYLDTKAAESCITVFFVLVICLLGIWAIKVMRASYKISRELAKKNNGNTLNFETMPTPGELTAVYDIHYHKFWNNKHNCRLIIKLIDDDTN